MSQMCRKIGGKGIMVKLDNVTEEVLNIINNHNFSMKGAFNLREMVHQFVTEIASMLKLRKRQIIRA